MKKARQEEDLWTEYMIDTFIDAATQNDHGIKRMPINIILSRIHRMLEESRWNSDIAKRIVCTDEAIVDVADRIVLWNGADLRACSRTLENRIDTWLKPTAAAIVVEFLGTAVAPLNPNIILIGCTKCHAPCTQA